MIKKQFMAVLILSSLCNFALCNTAPDAAELAYCQEMSPWVEPAHCKKCYQTIKEHPILTRKEKNECWNFLKKMKNIHCHRADLDGVQDGDQITMSSSKAVYALWMHGTDMPWGITQE